MMLSDIAIYLISCFDYEMNKELVAKHAVTTDGRAKPKHSQRLWPTHDGHLLRPLQFCWANSFPSDGPGVSPPGSGACVLLLFLLRCCLGKCLSLFFLSHAANSDTVISINVVDIIGYYFNFMNNTISNY